MLLWTSSHIDLAHDPAKPSFFALNNDKTVDLIIRNAKMETMMILITPEKKIFPPKGENYNWEKMIFLFIIKRAAFNKPDEIWEAQNNCEIICDDIFTQLHEDRYDAFTGFDEASWVMQPVGPMSDNFYGQVITFGLTDNFNQQKDPARWL